MMPSAECTTRVIIPPHNSQYVSHKHLKQYLEGRFGMGLDFGEKQINDRWVVWAPNSFTFEHMNSSHLCSQPGVPHVEHHNFAGSPIAGGCNEAQARKLSSILFSGFHAIDVWVQETKKGAVNATVHLQSPDEVDAHFCFSEKLPKFRLIWLSRPSSLAPFRVDYPCLRRMLDIHSIGPPFFDIFLGLRAKGQLLSETGHGLWMASTGRSNNTALATTTLAYSLHYMERRASGTSSQGGTWTERQIGVYHRFAQSTRSNNVMVLLHTGPGNRVSKHLFPIEGTGNQSPDTSPSVDVDIVQTQLHRPLYIHVIIFATYLQSWRWYLDEHGDHCVRLEDEVETIEDVSDPALSFSTLQELRNIESKLLTSATVLGATLRTLNAILGIAGELELERSRTGGNLKTSLREGRRDAGGSAPAMAPSSHSDDLSLHNHISSKDWDLETDRMDLARLVQSTQGYLNSVELIQARIAKLIQMIADGLAHRGNSSLLQLTEKSIDENDSIRTITIITLVYLPAQCVATFFGTNFVNYQVYSRRIQFADDTWLFLAIAAPLTITTLGIWLWVLSRRRREKLKSVC
ncbi:hypothetical protein GJ744_010542 [Endocarpon pusillum]|uniref:CorA-like transporter domain-containing protein n=1 Tax=Endocarpon pusillum TaxID=364733 RepID=A0A8H7EAV7_9EURO|nr:hypothetical protein GJ744_010542 [Endocarpon pusillum]